MKWSAILSAALAAALRWLGDLILGARRDDQAHRDAVERGRSDAAVETATAIEEVADAQAAEAARPRDPVDALSAELRARAARLGAGAGRPLV